MAQIIDLHELNTRLPQLSPKIGTNDKITLKKGINIELLFDSHHGIHNLRHVFDLAKHYGFKGKWRRNEDAENCEDAERYLNGEICVGCSILFDDDVWIVRDGYNMETGELGDDQAAYYESNDEYLP